MHTHAPLFDGTPAGGEPRLDLEHEVMELWASSLRAHRPSPAVWQRLLRSIDADEAALS